MAGGQTAPFEVTPGNRIDTRDELVLALATAAELEHSLLAQYLFAAYSLKKRPDEGITDAQVELCRSAEAVLLQIAREEMGHLATVTNLAVAVGGAPHLEHPRFPRPAGGEFGFEFTLERFSGDALQRFIRFETPADAGTADSLAIGPDPIEVEYVGELYRQIEAGFRDLAGSLGEQTLFVGPHTAGSPGDVGAGLIIPPVTDLQSALSAIDRVIEQGEAAPSAHPDSHWVRFRRVDALLRSQPPFEAARPVAPNPATRPHPSPQASITLLDRDSAAGRTAELFDVLYVSVLAMLEQRYSYGGESPAQIAALDELSRDAMSAILRPLAEVLTELPVGTGDERAGAPFESYGLVAVGVTQAARLEVLHERLVRAAGECDALVHDAGLRRLAFIAGNVRFLDAKLTALAAGEEVPTALPRG